MREISITINWTSQADESIEVIGDKIRKALAVLAEIDEDWIVLFDQTNQVGF